MSRCVSLWVVLALLLAFAAWNAALEPQATTLAARNPNFPSTLPPIPPGLPGYFSYGLFNATLSDMHPGVPYDFRYQYLAGGVNTGGGWQTLGTNYALNYVACLAGIGHIPGFIYYNILQSNPGPDEFSNLQNSSTMRAYYGDFKTLLLQTNDGGPAFINVEPDLDGVMMQDPSNTQDDASLQPSKVAATGMPELFPGIPTPSQASGKPWLT